MTQVYLLVGSESVGTVAEELENINPRATKRGVVSNPRTLFCITHLLHME